MMRAMAALLSTSLLVLAAGPIGRYIPIESSASPSFGYRMSDIAYCPATDRYLSVYGDDSASSLPILRGVVVDPAAGTKGSPIDIDVDAITMAPSLSWNGGAGRFLVVYHIHGSGGAEVYGRLLEPDGSASDSAAPFRISGSGGGVAREYPRVASDGIRWLAVWDQRSSSADKVLGRFVDGTGAFEGAEFSIRDLPKKPSHSAVHPVVEFGAGADFLVAWREYDGATDHVAGRGVTPSGTLGALRTFDLTLAPKDAGHPCIAAVPAAGEFIVGWVEQTYESEYVYQGVPMARRVDASGLPLSPPVIVDQAPDATRYALGGTLSLAYHPLADQILATWLEDERIAVDSYDPPYHVYAARLDRYDLSAIEADIVIASSVNSWSARFGAPPSLAVRTVDTQAVVQWSVVSGFSAEPVRAQRYDLGPAPLWRNPTLSTPDQFPRTGTAPVAPGGSTRSGFSIRADVESPIGRALVLEAEVLGVGAPFSGLATHAAALPAGGAGSIEVKGLPRGAAYHWQVRVVDENGRASDWTAFNGSPDDPDQADIVILPNAAPSVTGSIQSVDGGSRILATGQGALASAIRLEIEVSDEDGDMADMAIELRSVLQEFTGEATATAFDIAPGESATFDLELPPGAYHWRHLVADLEAASGWVSAGANADGETDFELAALGSSNSSPCSQSAGGGAWLPLLCLSIVLLRRNGR